MSSPIATKLSDPQRKVLQQGGAGLLITVGSDRFPTTAFVWAVAVSETIVRFATEGRDTLANLEREGRASLQVLGARNQVYLIQGTTSITKPRLEALPFDSTMMTLQITGVKDQTWPEVTVSPLAYEWSSERRDEWRATEQAVYQELKNWQD